MKKLAVTLLIVFLVLFCIFAAINYSCFVHSDPKSYLTFADSLAHGNFFTNYPPEQILLDNLPTEDYQKGFSTRVIKNGRSFSFIAIGYPLYLTPFLLLGGIYAPLIANIVVFIGFFIALYIFSGMVFKKCRHYRYAAILTVLLYFLMNREYIIYLLRCYRDPLSYLFILIGYCFYIKFFDSGERAKYLILTAFFLGLSCTVRETSVVCLIPLALLYIVKRFRTGDIFLPILRHVAIFVVFFSFGISILLVQNYLNSGNPFYPTQGLRERVIHPNDDLEVNTDNATVIAPGLKAINFPRTSWGYLRQLWVRYQIWFTVLFISGVVYGRRNDKLKYLILPFITAYFLFYSFYNSAPWRYLFIIHMAIVPIIAFAVMQLLNAILGTYDKYLRTGLILLLIFTACYMFAQIPEMRFQIKQARMFKEDFDDAVAANSVVISERVMKSHIDYFTDSFSFRFDDFVRTEFGITVKDGLEYFMKNFGNVYFFDNTDLGLRHRYDFTPVTEQKILDNFNLVPHKEFNAEKYNLTKIAGKSFCTLSRIERWKENITVQDVSVSEARDSILRINARKLWSNDFEREEAKLYFNEELLSSSIEDGVNYFYLSKDRLTKGRSTVRLTSDAPVPGDIEPEIISVFENIPVNIGPSSVPLDTSFFSVAPLHLYPEDNDFFRNITEETRVRIPTIKYPDSTLMISTLMNLKTEGNPEECTLAFILGGKEQARMKITEFNEWHRIGVPLKNEDIEREMSELALSVDMIWPHVDKLSEGQAPEFSLGIAEFIIFRHDNRVQKLVIDIGEKDEPYLRSGFYSKEMSRDYRLFRWTKGTASMYLPCFHTGYELVLEIRAWGRPEKAGDTISEVFVNDRKIGDLRIPPESEKTFYLNVPDEILTLGLNKLMFKTPTWIPYEVVESQDERELGILLESITLQYIDGNGGENAE